jgi:hypothetical protein
VRPTTCVIRLAAACAAAAVLAGAGCRDAGAPKTYPVTGKVVFKGGDARGLRGGYVRLQSVADPNVRAVGEIEDDGSFVLGTSFKERPLGGVPEGEYRILVEPPPPEDEEGKPRVNLHPRFRRFDTSGLTCTVGPGKENVLTLEVERAR